MTVTIEKLLVDAYSDFEFEFVHGMEIEHVFNNAFSRSASISPNFNDMQTGRRKKMKY